jgi:hypothetical protein
MKPPAPSRMAVAMVAMVAMVAPAAAAAAVATVATATVATVAATTVATVVATTVAGESETLRRVLNMAKYLAGRWCRRGAGRVGSCARLGWRIRAFAACMAPASRKRWLDLVEETLHDFDDDQRRVLLRDFRRTAVVVIVRSWTVDYTRSGASR